MLCHSRICCAFQYSQTLWRRAIMITPIVQSWRHYDIDLAFGRLRIKKGSSDGGHNGIKSTNGVLNPGDYYKLKVGVGRPPQGIDPADFVLSKFYNEEREEVEFLIEDSVDILNTFLKDKELAIKEASERRIIDVI